MSEHDEEDEPRRPMRRVHQEEVGLQIAPMIDVTMLLLFFFMLTGKLTQGMKLMNVSLPKASTVQEQKDKSDRDVINIDAQGMLYSGDVAMTDKEMAAYLKKRLAAQPPLKIYVRADANTHGKRIKEVMRMAAEAGAVTVIFAAFN
ncbi:MAG: ExbD/TolR family protein, partial [Roseimicrobium sp.]